MKRITKLMAAALSAATALSLAACGSDGGDQSAAQLSDDQKVMITWWGWGNTAATQAKDFMKKYPNITVKFQNIGSADEQYVSLNNAISAGKGLPDVAMIEYHALPQFVYTGKILDLTQFGADKLKDDYAAGPWNSVNINGGIYGLPVDSGPMAFFYNKEVFDKAGVDGESIKTWDDYYEAAKKIRAVGSYITSDSGDAGFYDSMVWLAGGQPFKTSNGGETVSIDLTGDKGTETFTEFWQKMIKEDLIDVKTKGWSDEWNHALGDGQIASLLTGAWMPINFEKGAAAASGKWRVAQMPTPDGKPANSENGGSSLTVLDTGDEAKEAAAYKLVEYLNHSEEGTDKGFELGVFPSVKRILESDEFLSQKNDYFGGQEINKVFAEASENVSDGWTFLPFEVYARKSFTDTVGKAFTGQASLNDGIEEWQDGLIEYAKQQGFTVK